MPNRVSTMARAVVVIAVGSRAPVAPLAAPVRRRIGTIMAARMRGDMTAINRALAAALFLFFLFTTAALAEPPVPALTGRVVDQAGILDRSTVETITSQLAGYESSTGNQVVVVTLSDLKGYPIEDWGLALGRSWGIGQKGKNNGVLLVVAPNDRALRIEVGYGLEGDLPDATANTIIDSEIVPHFKRGDMAGGVRAGVNAILAALGGKYTPTRLASSSSGNEFPAAAFSVFAFIFIVIVMINVRRDFGPGVRHGRNRRDDDDGFGWYGGSGGSSHSSGGGFSGGGGSFGGGGASGRW
jgi:uncharacterized protein